VIVTTYVVKVEGTFDGKDASGTYNAGSVWKKEKGAWYGHFSHECETGDGKISALTAVIRYWSLMFADL